VFDNAVTLDSIDFLPASYHEEGRKHRTKLWRLLVLSLFGGTIVATAAYQEHLYRAAHRELEQVSSQHAMTVSLTNELKSLEERLAEQRAAADLLTYLRHPWPRTQILASVLSNLPDAITLTELRLAQETLPPAPTVVPSAPAQTNPAPPAKQELAAESDLKKLRAEQDAVFWVVNVQGTTSEVAALHEHLARLGTDRLFSRVELGSISTSSTTPGASLFSVRLVVHPAYGHLNGPHPANVVTSARSPSSSKKAR